jgi:hypothetical protein
MIGKDAHDRRRHGNAFVRLEQHARIPGRIFVPRYPAETQAKINRAVVLDSDEADVIGVLQRADAPPAIKGNVKFPRQAIHLAVIEDVVMHLSRQRPRVEDLVRIDARRRAGGDVANIISTRAAIDDAQIDQTHEQIRRVSRSDLADLQIGAGGDINMAGAEVIREISKAAKLIRIGHAARKSQPAHERTLGRGDVEQALEFEQKNITSLGNARIARIGYYFVPYIKTVQFSLGSFLRSEPFARRDLPIARSAIQVEKP